MLFPIDYEIDFTTIIGLSFYVFVLIALFYFTYSCPTLSALSTRIPCVCECVCISVYIFVSVFRCLADYGSYFLCVPLYFFRFLISTCQSVKKPSHPSQFSPPAPFRLLQIFVYYSGSGLQNWASSFSSMGLQAKYVILLLITIAIIINLSYK